MTTQGRSQPLLVAFNRGGSLPVVISVILLVSILLQYPLLTFAEETTSLDSEAQASVTPSSEESTQETNSLLSPVDNQSIASPVQQEPAIPESQSSAAGPSGPSQSDDPYRLSREALSPSNFFYGNFNGGPFTYTYPISIPPGRNGVQPDLKLNYSSDAKRNDSLFGYGWGISIPYIERMNKIGLDKLFNQDSSHSYYYSSLSGEILPALSTTTPNSLLGFFSSALGSSTPLAQLDLLSTFSETSTVSTSSEEFVKTDGETDASSTQELTSLSDKFASSTSDNEIASSVSTASSSNGVDPTSSTRASSTHPILDSLMDRTADNSSIIKSEAISKIGRIQKTKRNDFSIEIIDMQIIPGGIQVFAKAWDAEDSPIGFGIDGTVEIERFRIFNPPILVDDPTGDIIRTTTDHERGITKVLLREDAQEALLRSLEHTIKIKKEKFGSQKIIEGKVGNTTSIFYPATGSTTPVDGHTEWSSGGGVPSWTTARTNAGVIASVTETSPRAAAGTVTSSNNYESIQRGIFIFDTSPLAGEALTSATLSLVPDSISDTWNTSNNIIVANPSLTNTLSTSDHQNFTFTRLSSDKSVASMTQGNYSDYTLNATGTTYINATGTTKFGFAMVYDIDGTSPPTTSNSGCRLHIRMSDTGGSASDPKLVVEHVSSASAVDLQVTDLVNPVSVATTSPYFSATFTHASTSIIAVDYRIQIATSSLFATSSIYWDSGRKTLASSTAPGMRSPNIFATTTFPTNGSTYYWRIQFFDQYGTGGPWSSGADYFTMRYMGEYMAKVEDGSFLRYTQALDGTWVARDKRGWMYIFGTSTGSRIDNVATSTEIFRWMLTEVRDPNGNKVLYTYSKDGGQIYPNTIEYTDFGGSAMGRVEFARTLRLTSDQATSSTYGFPVKTRYAITTISAKWGGKTVRTYQLGYGTGDNQSRTMLSSITQVGYSESGGVGTTTLPAVTFSYQTSTTTWSEVGASGYQALADFTDSNGFDFGNRLVDINGDALPDWIRNNGTSYVALNIGTGWDTAGSGSNGWTVPIVLADNSGEKGVRFADINADGLVDLIAASSTKIVYLNNGTSGWTASSSWIFPESFISTSGKDLGVQIADVNGDGLQDVLRAYASSTSGTTTKVYLHTGVGWVLDASWAVPEVFIDDTPGGQHDYGVRLFDYNADGLTDIVRSGKNPNVQRAYVNIGHGWTYDPAYTPQEYFANTSVALSSSDMGVRIADMNADGQADLMKGQVGITRRTDIPNLGQSWIYATGTIPEDFNDGSGKDYGVRFDDIDGNGLLDIVRAHDRTSEEQGVVRKVYLKNGAVPDLLRQMTNEHGGIITISYQASPKYATGTTMLNQRLPFVYQAVSGIGVDSGVGLGSHRVIATTTFEYQNGAYYGANILDRKFSGFGIIKKTNDKGEVVKTYFHQGNASTTESHLGEYNDHIAKTGRAYRTEILSPSTNGLSPIQTSVVKWARADYGDGRNFVKPIQLMTFSYAPENSSSHRETAQTFLFDDSTGNPSVRVTLGEVVGTDTGTSIWSFSDIDTDGATTTYSYAASSTNVGMTLPSRALVTDQFGTTISDTRWTYDGLSFGQVSKGNPTKEERLVSGSTYASTTKTYNAYGLVTLSTDPRGGTTTYVYDQYNLYVATTTNALGHTVAMNYDYSSGKVATSTDENARMRVIDFDGLDRPIREKIPDSITPTTLVLKTEYAYNDTAWMSNATATFPGLVRDNFNTGSGLLGGSLGGTGWMGAWHGTHGQHQNYRLQSGVVAEGSGAVSITDDAADEPEIRRDFAELVSGTVTFSMRREVTSHDTSNIVFGVTSDRGVGRAFLIQMGNDGNIYTENAGTFTSLGTYAAGQWYNIQIEFDCVLDQHRVKIGGGAWSPWYTFSNPKTSISNLVLILGNSHNNVQVSNYWDDLLITSASSTISTVYRQPASVFRRDYLLGATSTDSYNYIDGFDRVITVRKEAEPGNAWMALDTIYNTQSLTDMDSLPYFSSTSSYAIPTSTAALYTSYQYDALGRSTHLTDVFGVTTNTYDRWSIMTRDPLNNVKQVTKDAYGNIAQVNEQDGVATRTTQYLWNRLGKLTKLTDSVGNIRNFTYDNLGRLTLSEDLHASVDTTFGTTTRVYDDAGNVTQILNPRGQTITYAYDALNRPTSENYTAQPGTEVQYFYDTCTNGKTRLCSVRKQSEATTTYLYDPLGRVSAEGKTIGLGSSQSTATTSFTYLRNGAQDIITYPDGTLVVYLYDNAGLLDKVFAKESGAATSTVISRMTYTPLGQTEALDYGNGVTSTSTYDSAQKYRLTKKLSQKGATTLQNLSYTYDLVGNITTLDEQASTSARKTVAYAYDPLYRLTSASTTAVATGTLGYKQTYTYDPLGNLLLGPAGSYGYAQTGYTNPDAVTQILATTTIVTGGPSTSTPAYLQSRKTSTTSQITLPSSVATGSLIVVGLTVCCLGTIPSNAISDNKGNTYTRIAEVAHAQDRGAIFYAKNVSEGTNFTVTNSFGGTFSVHEYSGVSTSSPLDKWSVNFGTSTKPNSGSTTTTQGNELYFGLAFSMQDGDTWTAGSGYTLRETEINNATVERHATEDRVLTSASTTFADFSVPTSEVWLALLATFKPRVTNSGTTSTTTIVATTTYTYDRAGNLTSYGATTLNWDYNNRLASSSNASGTQIYKYDDTGARVQVTDSATTTSYWGNMYSQTNGGYKKTRNIYAGGVLIATFEKTGSASSTPYYALSDNIQSVTMLTNSSGVATQTLDYFPFGDVRVNAKQTSFDTQRKYIGQINDAATNLDYLSARYYDAARGQFTGQDPVSRDIATMGKIPVYLLGMAGDTIDQTSVLLNPQMLNFYSYSINNPIRLSDPSGLGPTPQQVSAASNLRVAVTSSYKSGDITLAQANYFFNQLNILENSWASSGGGGGSSAPSNIPSKSVGSTAVSTPAFTGGYSGGGYTASAPLVMGGTLGGGVKLGQQALDESIEWATKSNKLNHLFGKAKHGLEPLVEKIGSREGVVKEVLTKANGAFSRAAGAEVSVSVEGTVVSMRGALVDGLYKVGTIFVRTVVIAGIIIAGE